MDWLAVSPPVAGVQACVNDNVAENEILNRAFVSHKDPDAAVGVRDRKIAEDIVSHRVLIETADPDRARARHHGAVRDGNVL